MLDWPVNLPPYARVASACPFPADAQRSESAFVKAHPHVSGRWTFMAWPGNNARANCLIKAFIQRNYVVTAEDESGDLLLKKFVPGP